MSDDKYDIMFSKLKLKEGDSLVIKVNTEGLSEEDAVKKLRSIASDPFISFLKEKGHTTFVSYTGIDISILRLEENDKVLVNVDISGMDNDTTKQYINYIENKLSKNISTERLIIVPLTKQSTINVLKENTE